MKNATQLNSFQPHTLKHEIENLKIRQFDIAHSLKISQPGLSRMLNGITKMPENIENQINSILNFIRAQKNREKKH